MNANEFVSYFNSATEILNLNEKIEVHGNVVLNKSNFTALNLLFLSNITFNNDLIFDSVILPYHVSLINCTIKGKLFVSVNEFVRLENKEGAGFYITKSNVRSVIFKDCKIQYGLKLHSNSSIGELEITNCNFEDELSLWKNEEISFFDIKNSTIPSCLIHEGNTIEHTSIIDSEAQRLDIYANNFLLSFVIRVLNVKNTHIFQNNFDCPYHIIDISCSHNLRLENNTSNKNNHLSIKEANSILITAGKELKGLVVNKNPNSVNPINIKFNTSHDSVGNYVFTGLNINSFQITGVLNGILTLRNLKVLSFEVRSLFNYGQIAISNLNTHSDKQNSKLILYSSILGDCALFDTNLDIFSNISIQSTQLSNIKSVQTKWFHPNKLNNDLVQNKNTYSLNREIYRQLKLAMTAQADTIQALEFKNLEMAEYMKELKSKPIRNWKECSDVILMFLNRSNSYGINWIKPALLAVLYTAICYLAMSSVFYSNNLEIINPECGKITNFIIYTWSNKTRFFQLLDPTFKVSEVFGESSNLTFSLYAWATILKIGVAYLIFQTIAAFRKYLK